ncbi:MAG: hypothetical protein KDA61_17045 [Planctomycetales bacterium]|nr:hypothetical protein [Planctomycetales bacterium]
MIFHTSAWFALGAAALASIGCDSGAATQGAMGSVDVPAAVGRAMELYDSDSDGVLSAAELEKAPSLNYVASAGSGSLTRDQLTETLAALFGATSTGPEGYSCVIVSRGRPLSSAQVTFKPAEFLAGSLPEAKGTTDASGRADMSVASEQLPEASRGYPVVYPGLYQIVVEHSSLKKAHKPMGCQVGGFIRAAAVPTFDVGR